MTKLHLPKSFERARHATTPVLGAGSASLESRLRNVVEYHWGWVDAEGQPAETRPGKALRPTLVILSAEAVGGTVDEALAGAAAVEMIHDFTLLHDDVMDDDAERRGRPAAWTCFGIGPAICAGDALVLLAQQMLLADASVHRAAALAELLSATQEVIAGQSLDLAYEGRVDVGVEDYLAMSQKKTGALLGGSAAIGAILGGGSPFQIDAMREFGIALGLAFQAVDDWLGIWGDPERVGKPRASDLQQRKVSLPIAMAMASEDAAGRAMREWMGSNEVVDSAAIDRGMAWLDAVGAERATVELARRELDRALGLLDEADPVEESKRELVALARFVVEREF